MIITRTPFRISFFGGGTDYPSFYKHHDGQVLSTSIDKYCYITTRWLPPFFDHNFRIRYTNREEVDQINEIKHPSVRACLDYMKIDRGIEVIHTSDIPAMSGIGSSSSFTVGLLNALYTLNSLDVTKSEICQNALHIEQEVLHENVGSQDQSVAAFGGLNKIIFKNNKAPTVIPISIKRERRKELESHLMLFFTGYSRIASTIAEKQIKNTSKNMNELISMKAMVDQALQILESDTESLNLFGELLHESWMLKKHLTDKISNGKIDAIYKAALQAGAVGGKLCGAGAGGFMLLFVTPKNQNKVRDALSHLLEVPFAFEYRGTDVIFKS